MSDNCESENMKGLVIEETAHWLTMACQKQQLPSSPAQSQREDPRDKVAIGMSRARVSEQSVHLGTRCLVT